MALLQFADAGRLKQAYILSSPQRSEGVQAARRLAAAAVCTSGGAVPCMKCRGCRKALEGIHPDVIALRRPTDGAVHPMHEAIRALPDGALAVIAGSPTAEPGVYRVEGWLTLGGEDRGWIYSNPIYVRRTIGEAHPERPRP